jgi:uncharacterized protein YggE
MNQIVSLLTFGALYLFSPQQSQYVVTRGTATVKVPTDFIKIAIAVRTEEESLQEANQKNRQLVLKVLDVFRELAIPDSDFITTQSETQQAYSRTNERKFGVRYEGILTLRRPFLYDSLFASLVSTGDVAVRIQSFGTNNPAFFAAEAYKKAVSSAREQAKLLLAGSGQHVGKILKILQDGRDPFTEYDDIDQLAHRITQARPAGQEQATNFMTVSAQTVRRPYFEQSANVTVIFEIE